MLARKIFSLYAISKCYHLQNLQSNIETEEYESDTIVSMDKYISFVPKQKVTNPNRV